MDLWILLAFVLIVGVPTLLFYLRFTPFGRLNLRTALILKFVPKKRPQTIAQRRKSMQQLVKRYQGRSPKLEKVQEGQVEAEAGHLIPIRYYVPFFKEKKRPIIVFFHGGGWVVGDLTTHDQLCRQLSTICESLVVAVDYRLAPENPFPKGLEDCFEVVQWAAKHIEKFGGDPTQLTVMGDSAGGNLATAVCLKARNHPEIQIKNQILIYPVTNIETLETDSHHQFAEGYFLTREDMDFYRRQYVPIEADRLQPLVSPLLANNLERLPRALVVTAAFDPLKDEGIAYAERLKMAGNEVVHYNAEGTIHGFFSLPIFGKPYWTTLRVVADFLTKQNR